MRSLILSTTTRLTFPLLLLFSLFLLVRGHNEPGGGFAGGLVASAAFVLLSIAEGSQAASRALLLEPRTFIGAGLLIAAGSGFLALLKNLPYMTGLWLPFPLPIVGKAGTPVLFDIGVYLVVIGVVLKIVFSLAEED